MSLETVEMPAETAKTLFEKGAMLIFLNVPVGTEFGIDYNSWNVGEKFKGVKMIPPGFHFIYYSAKGNSGHAVPRTGFMHFFKQEEVVYKMWDPILEAISERESNSEDVERFILNKQELDQYLGVYPYNSYKKWLSLTNYIVEDIVLKVNPVNKIVSSATPYLSPSSNTQSRRASKTTEAQIKSKERWRYYANQLYSDIDEDERLPILEVQPGSQLRFSEIPRLHHPSNAPASAITRCCMDRSYTLLSLLDMYGSTKPTACLLGELQISFICFIVGQVFDAFEQWKRLVDLVSSSPDVMSQHPQLYSDIIFALHFQIREIPEDFFVDIVSRDNFLAFTLTKFFENMEVSEAPADLKAKAKRFQVSLETKFGWTFVNEDEEYQPVIVNLEQNEDVTL